MKKKEKNQENKEAFKLRKEQKESSNPWQYQ